MSEIVRYEHVGQALAGTLFTPPQASPRAAVLVFPSFMNSTPPVVAKARSLAEHGYLAMIADFYGENPGSFEDAGGYMERLTADNSVFRGRLKAALDALKARPEAAGLPVATIGFCLGGKAAIELARTGADLLAAVSFHGLLDTPEPAPSGAIKARLLVCHGDADPMVPREQVMQFWDEMDKAGADWHFHSYAKVKHGFTNPEPPAVDALGYDASADRQSWAAMLSLFDEILGPA